jgi:hypothetical protein
MICSRTLCLFPETCICVMALAYLIGVTVGQEAWAAERKVDLELVLAIDSSDSVDDDEFTQQIVGLAEAIEHPDVIKALGAGPRKAIVVSVVEWADRSNQTVLIPWTVLSGATSARALAERIRTTPRTFERGVTSISGIIDFAVASFAHNGFEGTRLVLDISSDGRQNDGRSLPDARSEAGALGVTINALTILNEYSGLDDYYRKKVITGTSAFVEPARDYDAYPKAILRKLIRELSNIPVVTGPRGPIPMPGHG